MATIQRSLLIDAPVAVCYAFWCDFQRFPEFLEDVSRVEFDGVDTMRWHRAENGETLTAEATVVEQIEDGMIGWQFVAGPERSCSLSLAALEGGATWFTCVLEYDPDEAQGDVAGLLTTISQRIDRELRTARELIEARAREQPTPPLVKERCD